MTPARPTLAALASIALAFGCDSAAEAPTLPARSACMLAVVTSDYRSSAVSLLAADGTLCAPDVLTSGSRPPGLLTALSGDVVLPFEPDPEGHLYVIDRYPNAVVTVVDPLTSEVSSQLAASPGYAGNPQDLAFTPDGHLLARLERAPATDPPDGSDLLLVAANGGTRTRIDLAAWADPGLDPMPTRFARAADRLWVGLTHLAPDFARAGPGRALALDPADLTVTHVLDLGAFQNCGTVASASSDAGLWIVCSGLFRNSPGGPQRDHSGLAWLAPDLASGPGVPRLTPSWSIAAADLHRPDQDGRPLGFTLAPLDDDRALVVALGDLATKRPDRLLLVARSGPIEILAEGGPFELGGVLARPADGLILVADASPQHPRIRRFTWPSAAAPTHELDPVSASPSGLPPRVIAAFRLPSPGRGPTSPP